MTHLTNRWTQSKSYSKIWALSSIFKNRQGRPPISPPQLTAPLWCNKPQIPCSKVSSSLKLMADLLFDKLRLSNFFVFCACAKASKINQQKQLFRDALRKRCSENMQQGYMRTPMQKFDFNKVAKQLYWNHTSAWVFSCKFAVYFENTFS